ncbi:MAG: V-type ATP synthase subunit F [Thermoplasmata archaeon]|nr:MAG: V-type ATP synthase subunit F [Thermoplasmata archaeon]
MELGVVGDAEFCLGFRLVGLRYVFEVEEDGDWEQGVTKAMAEEEVGILVMPSEVIPSLHPAIRQDIVSSVRPVVIPIGATEESDLREKIKQAVGVDLWEKGDDDG